VIPVVRSPADQTSEFFQRAWRPPSQGYGETSPKLEEHRRVLGGQVLSADRLA